MLTCPRLNRSPSTLLCFHHQLGRAQVQAQACAHIIAIFTGRNQRMSPPNFEVAFPLRQNLLRTGNCAHRAVQALGRPISCTHRMKTLQSRFYSGWASQRSSAALHECAVDALAPCGLPREDALPTCTCRARLQRLRIGMEVQGEKSHRQYRDLRRELLRTAWGDANTACRVRERGMGPN